MHKWIFFLSFPNYTKEYPKYFAQHFSKNSLSISSFGETNYT